jgi:hypothetical protein
MRMRRVRLLALACLVALVLAYVASQSLRAPQTGDRPVGAPAIGESARTHTEAHTTTAVAAPPPVRKAAESEGPGAGATASPEWLLILETPPDHRPPTDLGERLDAGPDEAWAGFRSEVDPVDIGPALDADDPPAEAPGTPTESLLHIVEPLDADNPQGYAPIGWAQSPLPIGELLDADAPTGQ